MTVQRWIRRDGRPTLELGEHQYLEITREDDVYHCHIVSHGEASPILFGAPTEEDAKVEAAVKLTAWANLATLVAFRGTGHP